MRAFDLQGKEIPDKDRVFSVVKRTGQRVLNYRKEMEFADSGRIILSMSAAPIYDEAGFFEGVVEILDDITDTVKTEKELVRERYLLQSITELSPIGIAMMNVKKQYVFANKKAEEIVGLPLRRLDQLIFDHPQHYITKCNGDYFPYNEMPYIRTMETGKEVHDVCQVMEWEKDEKRIVSVSTAPMFNENGEVENVISIFQDISERHRVEQMLQEDEERMRILSEVTEEGIIIHSEGKILEMNPSLLMLLGVEHTESDQYRTLQDFRSHFPDESWDTLNTNVARNVTEPYEVDARKKDGTPFILRVHGRNIVYKGKPARVTNYFDITREREIEQELRKERDRFTGFLRATPTGILVFDRDGRITVVNNRASEQLGLRKDEIRGDYYNAPHWKFTDCDGNPMTPDGTGFATVKRTGKPQYGLCLLLTRPDGSTTYLNVNTLPMFNERGEFDGAIATIEDISELVEKEKELRIREEQLSQLSAVALEGILITREDEIINISQSFLTMFGCEPSDADKIKTMKDLKKFFTAESWKVILKNRKDDYQEPFEVTGVKKDGTKFPVRDHGRIVQYKDEVMRAISFVDITREKQVENELRYERDRFDRFVETSPVGIKVINKHGIIVIANMQAAEQLGMKPEEVVGRKFNDPDFRFTDCQGKPMGEEEYVFSLVRESGKPVYDKCYIINRGDNTRIYITVNAAPLFDEAGRFDGAVVTRENITERVRIEQELRESEERLTQLAEVTQEGIIITRNDDIVNINASALRIFGYSPEETDAFHKASDFKHFYTPESWEIVMKHRREKYGEPYEVIGVKRDGTIFPIRIHGRNLIYRGEEVRVTSVTNITRQKETENALRYERDLFNKFVETSPIGIMVLNKEGEFTFASTQAREQFGLKLDEISGRTYNDPTWKFTDCTGKPMTEEELGFTRVKKTKEPVRDLCEIIERPDGSKSYVSFNLAPLLNEEGEFEGAVITAEDITERRSHEADLVKLNQEVELRAKQLEQSNRDLENFAFIASHDLNEPLNVIKGYASLLKKRYGEKFDTNAKEFMDYIEEETIRMQALIKGLLQLSRISTRGKPFRTFDPNEEMEAVIKHLETPIMESGAEISYNRFPIICGDRIQIGQVFQNLVSNSIKFRRKDVSPKIHLQGEERERDFIFSIQDNGKGIPEEVLSKIFDIFHRGRESKAPGSGIGLAITKKIVNRHG
jgi:PAS domain S-box-containing protein